MAPHLPCTTYWQHFGKLSPARLLSFPFFRYTKKNFSCIMNMEYQASSIARVL